MRCACGQTGTLQLKRRELPYCPSCFEHMLVRHARAEIGEGPLRLQPATPETEHWHAAASKLAALARREVIDDKDGALAGCAEIAAAHAMQFLFQDEGSANLMYVFPQTISKEELQEFYTPLTACALDASANALLALEAVHPGTISSVIRSAHDRLA